MTSGVRAVLGGGEVGAEVGDAEGHAAQDQQQAHGEGAGGEEPVQAPACNGVKAATGQADAEHHRQGSQAEGKHVTQAGQESAGGGRGDAGGVDQTTGKETIECAEQKQRRKAATLEEGCKSGLEPDDSGDGGFCQGKSRGSHKGEENSRPGNQGEPALKSCQGDG